MTRLRGYRKVAAAWIACMVGHSLSRGREPSAITSNWACGFIRRGQEPKYRTYLTGFQAISRVGVPLYIAPNSLTASDGFTVLKAPAS